VKLRRGKCPPCGAGSVIDLPQRWGEQSRLMKSDSFSERSRATAIWLFVIAALVFGMVILGGATRLTGSGLSITAWKPISGVFPPHSLAGWQAAFGGYQKIPQFRELNPDMTLAGFKSIFWWEWSHRLLGRILGVVFLLGLIWLVWTRRLPRRLIRRCVVLFLLGGLQGLVGWLMVASGLSKRVAVAPEWLMLHLSVALVIFCFAIWTGLEAWTGPGWPARHRRWRTMAAVLAGCVFVQIMLGALVAGNHAGQVFNDWPFMNGRLFPADFNEGHRGLAAFLHSQAAVQFDHRIGAYVVFALAIAAGIAAMRSRSLSERGRKIALVLAGLVVCQLLLGIATLMARAPLGFSLAHQCLAAVVLATAVTLAWRVRRA
jgi:cytochrome c oxidase assembly protein subunit 15